PARRQQSVLRDSCELHDAGARRRDPGADTGRTGHGESPGWYTDGHHVPAARQGHARRERTRTRRPVLDRAGAHAEKAHARTEAAARSAGEIAAQGYVRAASARRTGAGAREPV